MVSVPLRACGRAEEFGLSPKDTRNKLRVSIRGWENRGWPTTEVGVGQVYAPPSGVRQDILRIVFIFLNCGTKSERRVMFRDR